MPPFGIVANPASGKDIRRLVARASVFDNQEKQAIVERILIGARAVGAERFLYLDDANGIVKAALRQQPCLPGEALDATRTRSALDTITAARALRDAGCAISITLGGDGSNRAFALGWQDAPLIPLSTGTNNVFPELMEATIAGATAGLIASEQIPLSLVAEQQKLITVLVEDEASDLALIDAALSRERFVGARALLAPEMLQGALLTRAEPAAVGLSAVGGLLQPVSAQDRYGLMLRFGSGGQLVNAPIAPGLYRQVAIASWRKLELEQAIEVQGPGVIALDGERERRLRPGQKARFKLHRQGPWVVSVSKTLQLAARRGLFTMDDARPVAAGRGVMTV